VDDRHPGHRRGRQLSPWRARPSQSAAVNRGQAPASSTSSDGGQFVQRPLIGLDGGSVTSHRWRWRAAVGPVVVDAASVTLKPGPGTWSVGVRARDAVGNWSDWREVRAVVPVDDRRYAFSAGTTRRTSSVDYRGTLTTSSRGCPTTFVTAFSTVGDSGPGLRGRITSTVRAWSTPAFKIVGRDTRHRLILFSRSVANGTHSVTITNLATGGRPTIAIDGLAFVQ
jgi:hypothetical protein